MANAPHSLIRSYHCNISGLCMASSSRRCDSQKRWRIKKNYLSRHLLWGGRWLQGLYQWRLLLLAVVLLRGEWQVGGEQVSFISVEYLKCSFVIICPLLHQPNNPHHSPFPFRQGRPFSNDLFMAPFQLWLRGSKWDISSVISMVTAVIYLYRDSSIHKEKACQLHDVKMTRHRLLHTGPT